MILDVTLPADTEQERLLLGALLVMNWQDRRQAIRTIREDWFADDWHRSVFSSLVIAGKADGGELLGHVLRRDGADKRDGWWIASLFVTRSGADVCGQARHWRLYATRIQELAGRRAKICGLADQLKELSHEPC